MSTPDSKRTRGSGRRRFLKGIGASALGTAAVVFGSPGQASAQNYGCCHLVLSPSSYSTCSSHSTKYIWSCYYTAGRCCRCCENFTPTGSVFRSAYTCYVAC